MNTSLYISDLDGTLLRSDATLSAYSRDTLNSLLDGGLTFTVATARSVVSARTILTGLRLALPIIEFNGAFITDLATGRHEVVNAMATPVVAQLLDWIDRHGCSPLVSSFNGKEDCVYHRGQSANDGMQWYLNDRKKNQDRRQRTAEDLRCVLDDQVVCITVIDKVDRLIDLNQLVRDQHGEAVVTHLFESQYSPGWYWLTLHDRRATKDQGIRTLCERYNLAEHEVVVFGDHVNDVLMFKSAHRALAVANAEEQVKRLASAMIGSNDEDSVARFIHQDWSARIS